MPLAQSVRQTWTERTSAEYAIKLGRKRFRQYSLKRRVKSGRGKIKVDARESFFNVKTPTAIKCMSRRENIIELCTIGQNFPAVSYRGAYTFMNCKIKFWKIQHNPKQRCSQTLSSIIDCYKHWQVIIILIGTDASRNNTRHIGIGPIN